MRRHGKSGINPHSSRSHSILQFDLKNSNVPDASQCRTIHGKLTFIDLAGSERACEANFYAKQQTKHEGANINQSLLALKECIRAMDSGKPYAPFRQSKLTQVLRDSFLDECQLSMIAVVSPTTSACDNTLNTLKYAARVRDIDGGRIRHRRHHSQLAATSVSTLHSRDTSIVDNMPRWGNAAGQSTHRAAAALTNGIESLTVTDYDRANRAFVNFRSMAESEDVTTSSNGITASSSSYAIQGATNNGVGHSNGLPNGVLDGYFLHPFMTEDEEDNAAVVEEYLRYFNNDVPISSLSAAGAVEDISGCNQREVRRSRSSAANVRYDEIPVRDTTPSASRVAASSQQLTLTPQSNIHGHSIQQPRSKGKICNNTKKRSKPSLTNGKRSPRLKKSPSSSSSIAIVSRPLKCSAVPGRSKRANKAGGNNSVHMSSAAVSCIDLRHAEVQTNERELLSRCDVRSVGREQRGCWQPWHARSTAVGDMLAGMERLITHIDHIRCGEPVVGELEFGDGVGGVGDVGRSGSPALSDASTTADVPSLTFSSITNHTSSLQRPQLPDTELASKEELIDSLASLCQEEISVLHSVRDGNEGFSGNTHTILLNIYQTKLDKLKEMTL